MELAEMQVGQDPREARFVVSTVAEIEFMLPMFQRLRSKGRGLSVLYGMPLPHSQVDRLASLGKQLGAGSIVLMIDHASISLVVVSVMVHTMWLSTCATAAHHSSGAIVSVVHGRLMSDEASGTYLQCVRIRWTNITSIVHSVDWLFRRR